MPKKKLYVVEVTRHEPVVATSHLEAERIAKDRQHQFDSDADFVAQRITSRAQAKQYQLEGCLAWSDKSASVPYCDEFLPDDDDDDDDD